MKWFYSEQPAISIPKSMMTVHLAENQLQCPKYNLQQHTPA